MLTVKRFKKTQKFRIIVGDACFYSTASQIRNGIGDFIKCNAAVQKALDSLEYIRSGEGKADQCSVGLGGTWEGISVQINVA